MLRLGESDRDGRHEVTVGDDVELRLSENRMTGHRWQLTVPDGAVLVPVADRTEPAGAGRPGAAGERVFVLRAVGPGEARLVARSARPWEDAALAGAGLTFTVRVSPAQTREPSAS